MAHVILRGRIFIGVTAGPFELTEGETAVELPNDILADAQVDQLQPAQAVAVLNYLRGQGLLDAPASVAAKAYAILEGRNARGVVAGHFGLAEGQTAVELPADVLTATQAEQLQPELEEAVLAYLRSQDLIDPAPEPAPVKTKAA